MDTTTTSSSPATSSITSDARTGGSSVAAAIKKNYQTRVRKDGNLVVGTAPRQPDNYLTTLAQLVPVASDGSGDFDSTPFGTLSLDAAEPPAPTQQHQLPPSHSAPLDTSTQPHTLEDLSPAELLSARPSPKLLTRGQKVAMIQACLGKSKLPHKNYVMTLVLAMDEELADLSTLLTQQETKIEVYENRLGVQGMVAQVGATRKQGQAPAPLSYAARTALPPHAKPDRVVPVPVVIRPTTEGTTVAQAAHVFDRRVDTMGIRMVGRRVSNRDGNVTALCASTQEANALCTRIDSCEELKAVVPKRKPPAVTFHTRYVADTADKKQLVSIIRRNNPEVFSPIPDGEGETMKILNVRDPFHRNLGGKVVTLSVPPRDFLALKNAGAIFLRHERVRTKVQYAMRQCHRCLGYGHAAFKCTQFTGDSNEQICPFCSAVFDRANPHVCAAKKDKSARTCHNCTTRNSHAVANNWRCQPLPVNHSALCREACPLFRKVNRDAELLIDYGN